MFSVNSTCTVQGTGPVEQVAGEGEGAGGMALPIFKRKVFNMIFPICFEQNTT